MSCETTQRAIADCPYGSETLSLDAANQAHLNNCPDCQEFAQDKALTNVLTHITRVSVPLQWEDGLLKAAESKSSTSGAAVVWSYSAAASIFFALALTVFIVFRSPAPEINSVQLAVNEVKSVKFMLTSNDALSGANINISLSDNVGLVGFNDARQLSWKTDIKQGNNLLTLPVHLLEPVDGKIELQLEHEGSTKSYVITVSPKANSASSDKKDALSI